MAVNTVSTSTLNVTIKELESELVRCMTGDDLEGLRDIYILVVRLGLDLVYKGPI
jgi:hypothetical protein